MSQILVVGGKGGIGTPLVERLGDRAIIWGHEETDAMPELPPLDGLVYLPGTINLKPFVLLTDEDFLNDFEVSFMGAVRVIRHALPQLQKGASIVLMSTIGVAQGLTLHTSVSAAKGAVEGFMISLAAELAPDIRVNAVAPSLTETGHSGPLLMGKEMREGLGKRHPMESLGRPEEMAAAIAYLLSDDARWMTGQTLHVDGGLSSIRPGVLPSVHRFLEGQKSS